MRLLIVLIRRRVRTDATTDGRTDVKRTKRETATATDATTLHINTARRPSVRYRASFPYTYIQAASEQALFVTGRSPTAAHLLSSPSDFRANQKGYVSYGEDAGTHYIHISTRILRSAVGPVLS